MRSFTHSLGVGYATARDAAIKHMATIGHDGFLIGELSDDKGSLLDLLDSDLTPPAGWGQVSYREAAESLRLTWAPKPGSVGAEAPEEDLL